VGKVKIDGLAKEIARQVVLYTSEVEEKVAAAKDEVTKEAVALLKQTSPKDTGDYAKGWTRKKVGEDYIIHNRTDYQLTHLLEHGHVNRDGGRTPGRPHIRPVEEKTISDYLNRVEKAIKS
jgi:hypothetical protein